MIYGSVCTGTTPYHPPPRLYHQGYYDTMDSGFADEEGFIYIMSRSDDVINVAGHRLSAGALEEVGEIKYMKAFLWYYHMCTYTLCVCVCVFCSRCCSTPRWRTVLWWV